MQLPQALTCAPSWDQLPPETRKLCWRAARDLISSMQKLVANGEQAVEAMLAGKELVEWQHYPENDVRDEKNASQYFFHSHTGLQRPFTEHGHFHVFIHPNPLGLRAKNVANAPAHLVAISIDAQGVPSGFFIVNRWVTQGPWLSRAHCLRGLAHFQIKGRRGRSEINKFLRALLTLYQAQIDALLQQRDQIMQTLCDGRDRRSVFADRQIEVLCYFPIRLLDDIEALEQAM